MTGVAPSRRSAFVPAESADGLTLPENSADERRAAPEDGTGRRIRGRVLFPAGAPSDESLRVVALKEALAPRKVYGKGGVLGALAEGKRESALGSAPVAADGTFSLGLAQNDTWLALDGRFLYSKQVQAAPVGTDSLELAAELGGVLSGSVRVPEGLPAEALGEI